MTRAVVFDIGNVLIEWRPERYFDRVFGEDARRALFAEVDLHAMNDRVDRGEDFRAVIDDTIAAHPDRRAALDHWYAHWSDIAGPEIPGSVALLRKLREAGVPVFALSNFGVEPFARAEAIWPFLSAFDRRFISGHMRMAKPDAEIYAAVEAESGLSSDQLFFIDDRADNIAAADARGWGTHRFISPEALAQALVADGFLQEART